MNNTQSIRQKKDKSRLVRNALYANAIFSGMGGALAILAAGILAEFTGITNTTFFIALGAILIIYAADLIWVASREFIDRRFVWAAILLDGIWVLGSL